MLEVQGLTVRYGELTIVDDVSFCVEKGERLMIVGPNGAGKSTLVNAIMQGAPYTGKVLFEGEDVRELRPAQLARRLGMLMQNHFVGYAFTVEEVVSLGRYAYARGLFAAHSDDDEQHIAQAVERCGLTELLGQSVLTLSGGELQRTFLAQVFAQDPQLLILDEPTNHLDLVYQKRILELIEEWLTASGKAVLAVVHDLTLAKAFATRVMLMDKGRIVALDTPDVALSDERLQQVYGMDVRQWMQGLLTQWS
ncbi:MAG: ABC transporter ATP-binding protein [Coriobacteriia bacterium]|nr:ABC transporter ATP-binding protein [Coriobacteriia bacterium]